MNRYRSIKTLSFAVLCTLILISIQSCTNTSTDMDATAQALNSTQQALVFMGTDMALQSTQDAFKDMDATSQALNSTQQALVFRGTEMALHSTQDAIAAQPETEPTLDMGNFTFTVHNQANYSLCHVLISPSSEPEWLPENMFEINIPPGYYQDFYLDSGVYDIALVDCGEIVVGEEYGVNIPEYTEWTFSDSGFASVQTDPLCGNGVCGDFENSGNCPEDCSAGPTLSVSRDTMCRKCPTTRCPAIGDLQVGEITNVIARGGNIEDWWVVENYGVGGTCWIYTGYASVNGDISSLPYWNWYE